MFSRFFIDRPVFATVISIVIILAGFLAMRTLPIAQYPEITPPEVVVSAVYPGASAEVIASTVAAPLEQQINGVPGMIYMQSGSSNNGTMSLTVSFAIGTDPDQATIDVNNRVQQALARLPEEVRQQGVTATKRSSSILQILAVYSPGNRYDPVFLSNYALLNIVDELKRVKGVGDATLFGRDDYSMRIWLKPDRLARYNLTPADVANAIREQNSQFALGAFGQEPMTNPQAFTYTVTTKGRMATAAEFENIILRSDADGAATLRLKDIARVELGAQDYSLVAKHNGQPATAIGIYLQPGANALSTVEGVNAKMKELAKRFPEGVAYKAAYDTTRFVTVSIHEVIKTFIEAIILVILVVFLFLQNWRATLIPVLAVPVSLIGTFAGMYLLGFSINLLTLFGMVLAIGIVVDDAIVVLENVERLMTQEKLSPKAAAIKAMEEVSGPVVAIVLALCAVFIPVGFMGGLTGEMYKQFAITIAISVVISGFVALTLTPALCALILKPDDVKHGKFFQAFNRGFEKMTEWYMAGVTFLMRRVVVGAVLFALIIGLTGFMFMRLPSTLVPQEDLGISIVLPNLLPGSSLSRTVAVSDELSKRLATLPEREDVISLAGFDILSMSQKTSAGVNFVSYKDWDERTGEGQDSFSMVKKMMGMAADIKDAVVYAINPPPIIGLSLTGGFEGFIQSTAGDDAKTVAAVAGKVAAAANQRPELAGVRTTISVNVPQYDVSLNREKAKALGVPVNDVFAAMQSTFGSLYVNDFTLSGRVFRVNMQSEAAFREKPEDLRYVFVRGAGGAMIPLDSLVTIERVIGPDLFNRFNNYNAAKIMGEPAPGYSSGDALKAIQEVATQTLPENYSIGWTGTAYQEQAASGASTQAIIFGIIMVFLILAAQYERWGLPMVVIAAVPFALFGAVLATTLRGLYNDVYFQVGLLVLIGLASKNAILIVEFAVLKAKEGMNVWDAAREGARLRFRPIVMTSLAFILGCVPLAIGSGAGAASRHSIGTGVIGGMLMATLVETFFIPMFFLLMNRWTERRKKTEPAPVPVPVSSGKKGTRHA